MVDEEHQAVKEDLRAEYSDCGTNWRYWGDVRFKQLTVFLTANGVLGAGVLSLIRTGDNSASNAKASLDILSLPAQVQVAIYVLGFCGLALCLCFFLLEERATCYRRAYVKHAVRIEKELRLWQYRCTKISACLRSNTIYALLFFVVGDIWVGLVALFASGGKQWHTLMCVVIASATAIVIGAQTRARFKASSAEHLDRCPETRLGIPPRPETIEQHHNDIPKNGPRNTAKNDDK